jgi:hypothetical protein
MSIENAVRAGQPNQCCAGCRNSFSVTRQPSAEILISYPGIPLPAPIVFSFRVCSLCDKEVKAGGKRRQAMLAKVQAYADGGDE